MKRFAVTLAALALTTTAFAADSKLGVIKEKSSIGFTGEKVIGKHDGTFGAFDGFVALSKGKPSSVEFTIDLDTVKTDSARLDGHLKSPDFFDVKQFPSATFKSTKVTQLGANEYEVAGLFTLRGKTNPVTFKATTESSAGQVRVLSNFVIDRQQWDVAYKGAPDNLISDEVKIRLDLAFPAK